MKHSYSFSFFNNEWNTDCNIDNKILKRMAVHILETPNPSIKLSASRIIKALITNKNNPNVKIVIGSVRITKSGLTKTFKMANNIEKINGVERE